MSDKPDVTIIVPCYNEADHLRRNYDEIVRVMEMTRLEWEVIFVDDGSADGTRDIIREIAGADGRARFEFHEKNRGRGGAVKTGLALARAPVAGFLDIDLEVHCRYIPAMVRAVMNGADVACGYRIYRVPLRFDDLFRDILSVGYRFLARRLLGLPPLDTEAGYKFFNVGTTRALMAMTQNDGWFWDTEVMALAAYRGLCITHVPVVYIRDETKRTTVQPVSDSLESLRSLLDFRRRFRPGLPYRSPALYHAVMNLLYRGDHRERYRVVADLIPEGVTVLDVCCGDAALYELFLKEKGVGYTGLEINAGFVSGAAAKGIDVRGFDLETRDDVPGADYVVIQSSLYQFIPNHEAALKKLLAAAGRRLIVMEPVRNVASAGNRFVGSMGAKMTNPGTGPKHGRFTSESLGAMMKSLPVLESRPVCSGREMLYVIDAEAARREGTHD